MEVSAIIAIIGGIALIVGLFGGGVEAKEVKFPKVAGWLRAASILLGAALIGMAVWLSYFNPVPPSPTPVVVADVTDIPTVAPVPPTDTSAPSADTPTPEPPTDTPFPEPTETSTPEPTSTPTITQSSPPKLQVYDTFDDNCINTSLWRELAVWNGPTPSPILTDGCWDFKEYGFDERDGRLHITCSNSAPDNNRSYFLFTQSDRLFSDVEVDLTVESVRGGFGAVGLLFNLEETWSYYTLWYGGEWDINTGYVVFETEGRSGDDKVRPNPDVSYSLPAKVKLRLSWNGTELYFYVDGREVWKEPTQAYGNTLAIICEMGWNTDNSDYIIKGYVDEVRVNYR